MGELLFKAGREYGKNIINNYSEKLMIEVGKKYNYRTLYRMRKFYEVFKNEKLTLLVSKLNWSHCLQLLSLKNNEEIIYYINLIAVNNLSKRKLQEKITSHEYERLSDETKTKLIKEDKIQITDLVPNPILIRNKSKEKLSEYALKQLILNNLDDFLNQLGFGYAYIGNEYKIKIGNQYNYIDLLLYNIKYRCYVVIELKVTELKKEHTGQIQVYMNYINENIKSIEDNDTIGIIICKEDNQYIIRFCSDTKVIARTYLLI
jgi:predicted nuclease of restriction endonuclease-like (RecB) superfamily